MWQVLWEKHVPKALAKTPREIREKFEKWKDIAQMQGPQGLRGIRGFRDHALRGEWQGARASRLNDQWQVIYVVRAQEIEILILEITPHDYRKKS